MTLSTRENVLDRILATKRGEVAELHGRAAELRARALDLAPARDFAAALAGGSEVTVLAEIKQRSPSAGPIRPGAVPADVARAYRDGGAAALSVLTDEQYFGGSLSALREVREVVELPLLRKDFVIDPVQVWEARVAGADAVLLIARALQVDQLAELEGVAAEAGLHTLIEVHDQAELGTALAVGGRVVGVNNRDLATFQTDLGLSVGLAREVPPGVVLVAESGIRTADDVARLGAAGVDAVLVGESLMRQPDLTAAVRALVGVPRSQRGAT